MPNLHPCGIHTILQRIGDVSSFATHRTSSVNVKSAAYRRGKTRYSEKCNFSCEIFIKMLHYSAHRNVHKQKFSYEVSTTVHVDWGSSCLATSSNVGRKRYIQWRFPESSEILVCGHRYNQSDIARWFYEVAQRNTTPSLKPQRLLFCLDVVKITFKIKQASYVTWRFPCCVAWQIK